MYTLFQILNKQFFDTYRRELQKSYVIWSILMMGRTNIQINTYARLVKNEVSKIISQRFIKVFYELNKLSLHKCSQKGYY